jgi:hypothetical protein
VSVHEKGETQVGSEPAHLLLSRQVRVITIITQLAILLCDTATIWFACFAIATFSLLLHSATILIAYFSSKLQFNLRFTATTTICKHYSINFFLYFVDLRNTFGFCNEDTSLCERTESHDVNSLTPLLQWRLYRP